MQNRNPSQNHSSFTSFLDEAFARAVARMRLDPPAAEAAAGAAAASRGDARPDGSALLAVFRGPVDSILELAHRLAGEDPIAAAAVDRLRAAIHDRTEGRPTRIRTTDLFVVLGLLAGLLEPSVVWAVWDTVVDELAAVLGAALPLAIHITGAVEPFAELFAGLRLGGSGGHRACSASHPHVTR